MDRISYRICQWDKFENQLIFDWYIMKRLHRFFLSAYR